MFSKCLSKTVCSRNKLSFSDKLFINKNEKETKINQIEGKEINKLKKFNLEENDLKSEPTQSSGKNLIEKNNMHFNNNNNCKYFNNNNSNYKVESNVNVNVNLVTFPAYFNNYESNEKIQLKEILLLP